MHRSTKLKAKRLVGRHGRIQRKMRVGANRAQRRLLNNICRRLEKEIA